MDVPEKFVLTIRPFHDNDLVKIAARLRYRISRGAVMFWYELVRPEDIIRDCFKKAVDAVKGGLGEVPTYMGIGH